MKYFNFLFSIFRLYFFRFFLKKNVSFDVIQSHSLYSRIYIERDGVFNIKKNVQLSRDVDIFVGKSGELSIGSKTFFNLRCMISCQHNIKIGSHCLFGPDVKIYDNNHVVKKNLGIIHGEHKTKPISIGDNCWVGANVIILSGVEIGDNCIIGAGTILTKSVPENTTVTIKRDFSFRDIQ